MEQEQTLETKPAEASAIPPDQQAPANSIDNDPAEIASMMYTLYYPMLKKQIETLSNRQLRRVLTMLLEDKLIDSTVKLGTEEEKLAFQLFDRLIEAKYMLILHTFAERAMIEVEKMMAVKSENTQATVAEEKKEEVVNG